MRRARRCVITKIKKEKSEIVSTCRLGERAKCVHVCGRAGGRVNCRWWGDGWYCVPCGSITAYNPSAPACPSAGVPSGGRIIESGT